MTGFIGHYALGQMLPLRVWTVNGNGYPVEPDGAPLAVVQGDGGDVVARYSLPALNQNVHDGWFMDRISLDNTFGTGRYTVHYTYQLSGVNYGDVEQFEIMAGGDGVGAGIGLYFYRQPQADFLLLQTDTGVLKTRRNPRIGRN